MWTLNIKKDIIYIGNISENRVLAVAPNDTIVEEILNKDDKNDSRLMWKTRLKLNEGYFMIISSSTDKILTATSSDRLEIKGNIII